VLKNPPKLATIQLEFEPETRIATSLICTTKYRTPPVENKAIYKAALYLLQYCFILFLWDIMQEVVRARG